jgi:glycogen synthase
MPLVRRVGGLADTVIDATPDNLRAGTANGFVFDEPSSRALAARLRDACALYVTIRRRGTICNGMAWRRISPGPIRRTL